MTNILPAIDKCINAYDKYINGYLEKIFTAMTNILTATSKKIFTARLRLRRNMNIYGSAYSCENINGWLNSYEAASAIAPAVFHVSGEVKWHML